MFRRILFWAVSRYFGGAGRSWLFLAGGTLAVRGLRRLSGGKPRVEVFKLGKADHIAVDHLAVSHKRQIADVRAAKRAAKRSRS